MDLQSVVQIKTGSYQNKGGFFTIEVYLNWEHNLEPHLNISDLIDAITRKRSLHYYHISWLSPSLKIKLLSVLSCCQIVIM